MLKKRSNIIYAMQFMVQIVYRYKYGVTTELYYLCENEREKVHIILYDDRGKTLLSIGKGKKSGSTIIFMVFTAEYCY